MGNYKQCRNASDFWHWGLPSSFTDVWVSNYLRWPTAFSMKAPPWEMMFSMDAWWWGDEKMMLKISVQRLVKIDGSWFYAYPQLDNSFHTQAFSRIVNHQPAEDEGLGSKQMPFSSKLTTFWGPTSLGLQLCHAEFVCFFVINSCLFLFVSIHFLMGKPPDNSRFLSGNCWAESAKFPQVLGWRLTEHASTIYRYTHLLKKPLKDEAAS